jgi:hypothetical protein
MIKIDFPKKDDKAYYLKRDDHIFERANGNMPPRWGFNNIFDFPIVCAFALHYGLQHFALLGLSKKIIWPIAQ